VYVKALIRRSKVSENLGHLEESLEDVTSACILEGFSSESTLLSADRILKALGLKSAIETKLAIKFILYRKKTCPSRNAEEEDSNAIKTLHQNLSVFFPRRPCFIRE